MSEQQAYNPKAYWFSKIQDYDHCPAYFKAKHIENSLPEQEKGLDLEFGTALHLGLNETLQGGDGESLFNMYWDSVNPELRKFKFDHKCLRYNGNIFLQRFERLHAKHFKPFKMEERIFTQFGPHLIEGTPDALSEYKGVPTVVDFKTSSSKYDPKKILCEGQLSLYAALAEQTGIYSPKQKTYIVFVKDFKEPSIQTLSAPLTKEGIEATKENVVNTIEEIESRKVFRKNTSNCIRGPLVCPNFQACHGKLPNAK
jgi:hypothetical protein